MDSQAVRVEGTIASDELLDLITSADPGHTVKLGPCGLTKLIKLYTG